MRQKSNMPPQKDFSRNPTVSQQRSVFNRTHAHKSTFNVDTLVPFYADEILPGDSQDVKANIFARLSSPLGFPIMDNMFLDTFYFFVPNRLLWDNWEEFMGANKTPLQTPTTYQVPQVTSASGDAVQSLSDFPGIPSGTGYSVCSFWHRAYSKIYNEFFKDENLIDNVTEYTGDGPEVSTLYPLQKRGKRHDYFTSCLPTPQKGDAVEISILTGNLPVRGTGIALGLTTGETSEYYGLSMADPGGVTNHVLLPSAEQYDRTLPFNHAGGQTAPSDEDVIGVTDDETKSGMEAVVSGAQSITINDLRMAVATQQLLELDNRGGTRYFEILKAHFGVDSPDSRLQRAEYLGGGSQMINVNPVTQTSESNTTAQGEQAAFVTASSRSGYSKSFVEHGVVLGIVNVRADLTYQQGINRMFNRLDRYDYYFPTFANLGEQAVLNGEIYHQNTSVDDDVFGYNEHWSELRYKPSLVSGRFRTNVASSLDTWHLSEDFSSLPALDKTFIEQNLTDALNRTMTAPGTSLVPQIIFDSYIEIRHARCMPTYSMPGLKRL